VDLTELYVADEVFIAGTSAFVAPVVEIDARKIADGKTGPMTLRFKKMHEGLLRRNSKYSTLISTSKPKTVSVAA
jgi:branched-chain amino acid aminotransferase